MNSNELKELQEMFEQYMNQFDLIDKVIMGFMKKYNYELFDDEILTVKQWIKEKYGDKL